MPEPARKQVRCCARRSIRRSNRGYLLDTSAILAFTDNEDGADTIEGLLKRARANRISLNFSSMTAMELYYVCTAMRNDQEAHRLLLLVRALPIEELTLDTSLILPAARLKARHKISVADAWIAATAEVHDLILIHKDPEFESLKEKITLLTLPYKRGRKN